MKFFIALALLCSFLFAPLAHAQFKPRKVGFNIGGMDPYPSPLGFGLSYFFEDFAGITAMTGIKSLNDTKLATFTGGFKFMATREKISPAAFLGVSSYETDAGVRSVIGYIGVGANMYISENAYLGLGGNFSLGQREGKSEITPYFHFGVLY